MLFRSSVLCVAHNAKGYDSHFLLKVMVEKYSWEPEMIMKGGKILSMKVHNVHFIDSLNFLTMALSKLPKAFELPSAKGYFPHFFNTKENASYVGRIPDPKFYGADSMSVEEREKFLQRHDKHQSAEFDFKQELVRYCVQDVNVLRQACVSFMQTFESETKVNPLLECVTIASACSLVFRRNFLHEKTIGLIPNSGYRWADRQSLEAIQWLVWEEKQRNITINHATRTREKKVAGMKVDR